MPRQPQSLRPDQPFLETNNGITTVWPTKLAFAPALSTMLLTDLQQNGLYPANTPITIAWPQPLMPKLPWEICDWYKR
ncbi:hypothetical protein TI03_07300 [Achromatium sp. WMS1]|nr:hypothetical protein TI03_07300 [Achromatium sp. WMS1]